MEGNIEVERRIPIAFYLFGAAFGIALRGEGLMVSVC